MLKDFQAEIIGFFILLFAVFLLFVAGIAVSNFFWFVSQPASKSTPSQQVAPPPAPTPEARPNPFSSWRMYRSTEYGFEFKYPIEGQIIDNEVAGEAGLRVDLPYEENTLLAEKYLHVAVYENEPEQECVNPDLAYLEDAGEMLVEGVVFQRREGAIGAAGSLYESSSYSAVVGDYCYALTFVLRSANPGAFGQEPPPDFDRAKETEAFSQILSTFRFVE